MEKWGVPFHTIENEWTDDQYFLMVEKLSERIERENESQKDTKNRTPNRSGAGSNGGTQRVSHESFKKEGIAAAKGRS
jgi:hypothetical protein